MYDCSEIKMADSEGTSDVFVRAWLSGDSEDRRETDTHWRCADGNPSFNYRLLFDVQSPKRNKGADA